MNQQKEKPSDCKNGQEEMANPMYMEDEVLVVVVVEEEEE